MKKLLASDYDGTFYLSEEDILNNISLTKKFMKKNIFAIATGRSYLDFMKKKIKYNIPYHYLAINHGATIIYCDHVVYNKFIDNQIKDEIIKLINKEKYEELFFCSKLESRVDETHDEITKIHIEYNSEKTAAHMYDKLRDRFKDKINCFLVTNGKSIEIVAGTVDKVHAVEFIANKERINNKKVYTIGNGDTDIKMVNEFNGYMILNDKNKFSGVKCIFIKNVSELIKNIL